MAPTFFNVSLPACHGLRTPADHTPPCQGGGVRVAFGGVQTLGIRDSPVEAVPALQGTRLPLRPPGYTVDASPILFAVSPRLRHGRKTRYGWVATPYPTGTFTLLETPSFSWRCNARAQRRVDESAAALHSGSFFWLRLPSCQCLSSISFTFFAACSGPNPDRCTAMSARLYVRLKYVIAVSISFR